MNKTVADFEKYLTDMNYIYSKKQGLMNAFKKIELWESVTNVKIENWRKEFLIELCKKGVELKKEDYNNSKLKRLDLIKLSGKICNSSYYGHTYAFSSVAQSCQTLGDPMNCSMPDFPTHHQLLEIFQYMH